ncbi:mycothiol synthase [Rugosimonospora acidiphila]|uniref:Mycothiol acetyltransferase n=1 Tax=Rugosimonospora acidiphila TaxID=556531 RepID=A0ABP9RHA4_9ACTN
MTSTLPVRRLERLDPQQVSEVIELTRAASDADGVNPLSEHVMLHLSHGGDEPAEHLLIRSDGRLVGYAHVDTTDTVEGASAELVVHPMFRRRGLGRALVTAVTEAAAAHDPSGRLRLWAHGDHPSASALALSLGFERHRVLYQMRRPLDAPIEAPALPADVRIRAFRPGADDERWVELNGRAFAHHPDQGRWTLKDLRVRMTEPWFDPTGFLIAERAPEGDPGRAGEPKQAGADEAGAYEAAAGGERPMLGFHWTKVHGARRVDGTDVHQHDPIGEVYVLGVDPDAQGLGLGTALTLAGLRHLRDRGLDQAMLYVDGNDSTAVHLYQKNGFVRWSTDVSFRRGA